MIDNVLVRFLGHGLIDVGGDDQKFEKLQQTGKDLASVLVKTPSLAASFALIACDPQAPTDDPMVEQALAALKVRWPTYVNTFSTIPVTVVRALLLDALGQAAADDERIGVAFVTSARNALPFMEVGDERGIWEAVIADIERKVDARAEAEWATPETITVPDITIDAPKFGDLTLAAPSIKRSWLVEKVRAAGGPQYYDPQTGNMGNTGGNPHWPGQSPPHWNTDFSKHMADAIGEAVETVTKKMTIEQPNLSATFEGVANEVGAYVKGAIASVSGATSGLQRRTNLLWWKEARYSPSAGVRYRELPTTTAAALMGYDLHVQVPTFSPASVAAFLFETVDALPGVETQRAYGLRDLVSDAQTSAALAKLRNVYANLVAKPEGRGPVLALIVHSEMASNLNDAKFERLTGVPANAELTLPEWAAWIFRELQAARAVTDGGAVKRRPKKS